MLNNQDDGKSGPVWKKASGREADVHDEKRERCTNEKKSKSIKQSKVI